MSRAFAQPIRTPRTFEAAIEEILAGIERSRLRPGTRLPNEAELAGQLDISKPTLRQALRVLERSGVIVVRAGKGGGIFLVSELLPYGAVEGNIAVETNAVVEVLLGRRVIERAVTHAAAAVASRDDYAELERVNGLIAKHRREPGAVGRADAMFHAAVARSAHNRLLADSMRLVGRQLSPLRDIFTSDDAEIGLIVDIHTRQIRAMRNREPVELDTVLDAHFRILEERFALSVGQTWATMFVRRRRRPQRPFEPPWQKLATLGDDYRAQAWLEQTR